MGARPTAPLHAAADVQTYRTNDIRRQRHFPTHGQITFIDLRDQLEVFANVRFAHTDEAADIATISSSEGKQPKTDPALAQVCIAPTASFEQPPASTTRTGSPISKSLIHYTTNMSNFYHLCVINVLHPLP